jgi:hypothetical protein
MRNDGKPGGARLPSTSCLGLRRSSRCGLLLVSMSAGNGFIIMHGHVSSSDIRSTIERQLKQVRDSLELLKQPKPSTFCGKRHYPPPTREQPPPIHDWVDAFRLYPQKE